MQTILILLTLVARSQSQNPFAANWKNFACDSGNNQFRCPLWKIPKINPVEGDSRTAVFKNSDGCDNIQSDLSDYCKKIITGAERPFSTTKPNAIAFIDGDVLYFATSYKKSAKNMCTLEKSTWSQFISSDIFDKNNQGKDLKVSNITIPANDECLAFNNLCKDNKFEYDLAFCGNIQCTLPTAVPGLTFPGGETRLRYDQRVTVSCDKRTHTIKNEGIDSLRCNAAGELEPKPDTICKLAPCTVTTPWKNILIPDKTLQNEFELQTGKSLSFYCVSEFYSLDKSTTCEKRDTFVQPECFRLKCPGTGVAHMEVSGCAGGLCSLKAGKGYKTAFYEGSKEETIVGKVAKCAQSGGKYDVKAKPLECRLEILNWLDGKVSVRDCKRESNKPGSSWVARPLCTVEAIDGFVIKSAEGLEQSTKIVCSEEDQLFSISIEKKLCSKEKAVNAIYVTESCLEGKNPPGSCKIQCENGYFFKPKGSSVDDRENKDFFAKCFLDGGALRLDPAPRCEPQVCKLHVRNYDKDSIDFGQGKTMCEITNDGDMSGPCHLVAKPGFTFKKTNGAPAEIKTQTTIDIYCSLGDWYSLEKISCVFHLETPELKQELSKILETSPLNCALESNSVVFTDTCTLSLAPGFAFQTPNKKTLVLVVVCALAKTNTFDRTSVIPLYCSLPVLRAKEVASVLPGTIKSNCSVYRKNTSYILRAACSLEAGANFGFADKKGRALPSSQTAAVCGIDGKADPRISFFAKVCATAEPQNAVFLASCKNMFSGGSCGFRCLNGYVLPGKQKGWLDEREGAITCEESEKKGAYEFDHRARCVKVSTMKKRYLVIIVSASLVAILAALFAFLCLIRCKKKLCFKEDPANAEMSDDHVILMIN